MAETPVEKQAEILADLWLRFGNDPNFADFMKYNDLGMPLAYAVSTDIIQLNPKVETFVGETFALFLAALSIEDEGFDSLEDILMPEGE